MWFDFWVFSGLFELKGALWFDGVCFCGLLVEVYFSSYTLARDTALTIEIGV